MKDLNFVVKDIKFLNPDVFELELETDEALPKIRGGQFLNLAIPSGKFLLRRPFCVYKADSKTVTLVIAVVGNGTKELSKLKKGELLKAILPLGNGFILDEKYKNIALVGGGVGCAPLLPVINGYNDKKFKAYLGFSSKDKVLFEKDFKTQCETVVATDDATYGEKGFITTVFENDVRNFKPDVVLTCGPEPMLKALKSIIIKHNIPAFMSGEAHMACGVGACLVCACAINDSSGVPHNLRACADGPVFRLEDIVL